jgi:hypothetical protein
MHVGDVRTTSQSLRWGGDEIITLGPPNVIQGDNMKSLKCDIEPVTKRCTRACQYYHIHIDAETKRKAVAVCEHGMVSIYVRRVWRR